MWRTQTFLLASNSNWTYRELRRIGILENPLSSRVSLRLFRLTKFYGYMINWDTTWPPSVSTSQRLLLHSSSCWGYYLQYQYEHVTSSSVRAINPKVDLPLIFLARTLTNHLRGSSTPRAVIHTKGYNRGVIIQYCIVVGWEVKGRENRGHLIPWCA